VDRFFFKPYDAELGFCQPHVVGPVLFASVNKRSSALNASVAAGIGQTAALVQSSSYSRAVHFPCEEKFVLSG